MKSKLTIGLLIAALFTVSAFTQTNNLPPMPPDPLTAQLANVQNIDTNATIFARDTMEIRLGAVSQGITGTSFDSSLGVSYYFHPNFGIGAQIVNGNVNGGVQSANLSLELRKPIGNFCIGAFMGAGRNIEDNTWQAEAGVRASYALKPESRMFTYVSSYILATQKTVNKPTSCFEVGVGYAF